MTTQESEPEYPNGYTYGIYLPSGVSKEVVEKLGALLSKLSFGMIAEEIGQDPAIVGHKGDVFQVDSGCGNETCERPHLYLATSCYHGEHGYCQANSGLVGLKIPGVCKFCRAPCLCRCHQQRHNDEHVEDSAV